MTPRKERSRKWEKLRREKLNSSFVDLSKVLPNHDSAISLSKLEILLKAIDYIKELEKKLKDVLTAEGRKKTKEPKRCSNRFTSEQAKQYAKEEAQKENKNEGNKSKRSRLKSTICKNGNGMPKQKKKVLNKNKNNKQSILSKKPAFIRFQLSNLMPIANQRHLTGITSQSCFIITSNASPGMKSNVKQHPSTSKLATTVLTNSSSLAAPKMATAVKPSNTKVNAAALNSLGPGTLILANGNIVPILHPPATVLPPPTILTNSSPILLKPPTNNTTLILMPTKTTTERTKINSTISKSTPKTTRNCTTTKTLSTIRPKHPVKKPVPLNKVPIASITSSVKNDSKKVALDKTNNQLDSNKRDKVIKRKSVDSSVLNGKRVKQDSQLTPPTSESTTTKKTIDSISTKKEHVDNSLPKKDKLDLTVPLHIDKGAVPPDKNLEITTNESPVPTETQENTLEPVSISKNNEKTLIKPKPDELEEGKSKSISLDSNKKTVIEILSNDVIKNKESKPIEETEENSPKAKVVAEKIDATTVAIEKKPTNQESEKLQTIPEQNEANNCSYELQETQAKIPDGQTKVDKEPSQSITKTVTSTVTNIPDKNLELGMNLNHSELSNDIFSTLQVPIGGQNPESTSPTAAFLLTFPLVSSLTGVKEAEVIDEENSESRHGTPTLLQIGTMDTTKTTQSVNSETLTPNLLNLDNYTFFSGKDLCNNFYTTFDSSTCSANNAYSMPNNTKSVVCAKNTEILNACESHVPTKSVIKGTITEPHIIQNSGTTSQYEAPIKHSVNTSQSNFIQQNTPVCCSKLTSVSTTYAQGISESNNHLQYQVRHKVSTSTTTCKDASVLSCSTLSKRPQNLTHTTTSLYPTVSSNTVSVANCNAFNPFSDFSKANTVHSYPSFSKPYNNPLYTNSTYTYNNEHNFDQNMYYPAKSLSNTSTYSAPNYSEGTYNIECKNDNRKRDPTNARNDSINYYHQAKAQQPKHNTKSSKSNPQPKPPINWMTTPDFRSQPSGTDYLVPPPFAKDIDYNPNSFYSSNSFASSTHTSYFNATSSMYPPPEFQNSIADNRKTFDSTLPIISTNSAQRNEFEENQFAWSPTKLPQFLDTSHSFVSTTLPTLVGDLALGTIQPSFVDQKLDHGNARDHLVKPKETNRRSKTHPITYDNQSNFLSVSQLVESKTDPTSTRSTNRRNSVNRNVKNASQKTKHSQKSTESKEHVDGTGQPLIVEKNNRLKQNMRYNIPNNNENSNWIPDCNKPANRHPQKSSHSSYSAEALIGHQDHTDTSAAKQRYRQQQNYATTNKTLPIPTFLSDNIVPYFPPVELPQDSNFASSNTNYQNNALSHSFTSSVQNNVYGASGTSIPSSYLPSTGLVPEYNSQDYSTALVDTDKTVNSKQCNRNDPIKHGTTTNNNRIEERSNLTQQIGTDCSANPTTNFLKKTKHRPTNENNVPGLVDFGFLSMPSTINSPILPDDFHGHSNFLPPPPTPSQLYSCKNPLYSKQPSELNSSPLLPVAPPVPVTRNNSQHFEASTTSSSAGSSFTSFNLSAIFPEINKGTVPLHGLYSDHSKSKNYNFQRNYLSSSVQVSFNNKPTTSSSYVNSIATTYANNN